jgi:chemotaxis protein MotB
MSRIIGKSALSILVFLFFMVISGDIHAALFYTPSQYNAIYNEKVALELELQSVRKQLTNELANLESENRKLESEIDTLNKKIEILGKQMAEDKELADKRIKELEERTDILKKSGSMREKELIEENRKLQRRYEAELKELQAKLKGERENNLKEIEKLKGDYDKEISSLKAMIATLNDELSSLKKLTKLQKRELERMEAQASELEKQLEEEIKKGEIRLKRLHDKLIINIDDRICFDSGSAKLKKDVLPALNKIRNILSKYPENRIVIEGHTDNVPIHTAQFRDNWQLSTERALSVLNYVLQNKKLDEKRFSAAGYGEFNPIVSNKTAENRALNRRVDIVVIPRIGKGD